MTNHTHRSGVKLTPKQVRELLEVCDTTLTNWRKQKKGPPYHREVNRIYYYREDLDKWRQATRWADS